MKINLPKAQSDLSDIKERMALLRGQLRGLRAQAIVLENFIVVATIYEIHETTSAPTIDSEPASKKLH